MRDATGHLLVGSCGCAKRLAAQAAGEFVYLPHARAWVFAGEDAPIRSMTWRARYYADDDHSGEPYLFHCCPFCGHDLNGTDDPPRLTPGLGDPDA